MALRWPERLWIVRHGESAGNVARDAADAAGPAVIDIAERDVDVPLVALGEEQADALGRWFAELPAGRAARGGADLALRARAADGRHRSRARRPRAASAGPSSTSGCAKRSSASSTG